MLVEKMTMESGRFVWPDGQVEDVDFAFGCKSGQSSNMKQAWFFFKKEKFAEGNPRFEPTNKTPRMVMSFYDDPFGNRDKRAVKLEL